MAKDNTGDRDALSLNLESVSDGKSCGACGALVEVLQRNRRQTCRVREFLVVVPIIIPGRSVTESLININRDRSAGPDVVEVERAGLWSGRLARGAESM